MKNQYSRVEHDDAYHLVNLFYANRCLSTHCNATDELQEYFNSYVYCYLHQHHVGMSQTTMAIEVNKARDILNCYYEQKHSGDAIIRPEPFTMVVKEEAQDIKADISFTEEAIEVLHVAAENYIVEYFQNYSQTLAKGFQIHGPVTTTTATATATAAIESNNSLATSSSSSNTSSSNSSSSSGIVTFPWWPVPRSDQSKQYSYSRRPVPDIRLKRWKNLAEQSLATIDGDVVNETFHLAAPPGDLEDKPWNSKA